ncbi:Pol polyprotein [Cucumis melo var. makuwa]|uniref:Pol polyprotein n=1 Tax=Cucumis melo var. makuwa TaxID=1194695 RepID=A0A5A7UFV7_CUCMM|nr:Pol polyprotein [Cucumis melo var. makuwa]
MTKASQIEPKASIDHQFILVAIDYFTKWVKAVSYKSVTKQVIVKFIWKDIICQYGLPEHIITVEGRNKNIKKVLEKMFVAYRYWHEMLPFALYGYRISVRTSTGATAFSPVYGFETILPIEVEVLSLGVIQEVELDEEKWAQVRYEQLNFIEERRLTALCRGQLYQKKIAGDLVLKWILSFSKESQRKIDS